MQMGGAELGSIFKLWQQLLVAEVCVAGCGVASHISDQSVDMPAVAGGCGVFGMGEEGGLSESGLARSMQSSNRVTKDCLDRHRASSRAPDESDVIKTLAQHTAFPVLN